MLIEVFDLVLLFLSLVTNGVNLSSNLFRHCHKLYLIVLMMKHTCLSAGHNCCIVFRLATFVSFVPLIMHPFFNLI